MRSAGAQQSGLSECVDGINPLTITFYLARAAFGALRRVGNCSTRPSPWTTRHTRTGSLCHVMYRAVHLLPKKGRESAPGHAPLRRSS